MNYDLHLNIISFFIFLLFLFISFLNINRKFNLNKKLFLLSLLLTNISYSIITVTLINQFNSNQISIILFLSFSIILWTYMLFCLIDYSFIRLRLLFIPYFFIFILILNLSIFYSQKFGYFNSYLFDNKLLSLHIVLSLLSYSFLTISAISSIAVFAQERSLKSSFNRTNKFLDILPSMYESEKITIKVLYVTQFFLLISLLTGYFYSKEVAGFYGFIYNEKSILSIITFFLICILLLVRFIFGITGKKVFNFVLLSYLFINLAYFGYKIL